MASVLQASQTPPSHWEVTAGEVQCSFLARDLGSDLAPPETADVPDMYVSVSSFPDESRDPDQHFLQPVSEHWLKKAINIWRDNGLLPALECVASNPAVALSMKGLEGNLVRGVVSWSLALWKWTENGINHLWSHTLMSAEEMVAEVSPVTDWEQSPVHAMDLHPRLPYIAFARQDDTVEIRHFSEMEPSISLRDKDQRLVTCLQWAPHSNTLLAVGAKVGVLLWNVELTQSSSRFVTSWVRIETSPGHVPVATISWSPCSNYLISGSPADTSLVVWDVPMGVATRVRRREGGGVCLVSVSPGGARVLAASVGGVIRVWETENWTCEKWNGMGTGRCQAACWSPLGDFLLFALSGDHTLYYIGFHGNDTASSVSAVRCADLTPVSLRTREGEEPAVVGGAVQSMAWDPTGQRLAIIFSADSPSQNLVAVLRTSVSSSMVEVMPGGFIRGEDDDMPQLVSFQRNCSEGALLAVAWLSGRVSFTPLLFTQLTPSLHHQPINFQ